MVPSFKDRLRAVNPQFETFENLQTLQVNLGNLCNLCCTHCHVNASSHSAEVMGTEVMGQISRYLARHPGLTLDITGGCPEMNPNFRFLIERTNELAPRRILRSNLAIMAEKGWEWLPEYCRSHELIIVGSLPCYLEENVDRQRGKGVYRKSIQVLKRLNSLGYGSEVELDIMYNPGGDFVSGSQLELEAAYKMELSTSQGIVFNHLFALTNAPIGRFREHLESNSAYAEYLQLLAGSFNPMVAGTIMCRTLISVDWQGKIYNCDFNQALGLPVTADDGSEITISELQAGRMDGDRIHLAQHCYCCTAGEGSSCTGALAA